jgi:pimeloyl-ACP methyl ester carboxylesterase
LAKAAPYNLQNGYSPPEIVFRDEALVARVRSDPVSQPALFTSLTVLACSGCIGLQVRADEPVTSAPCGVRARNLIVVADGAGGFRAASNSLRETAVADSLPLEIETFPWTHGHWRILADQIDKSHARREGSKLAGHVASLAQTEPGTSVSLVGHSAGCAVVLAAAETLPASSVERIVLLSPSVSSEHDLRPALTCARRGVDVFYSTDDLLYLGLAVVVFGNADRERNAAAGRVGFHPVLTCAEDAALYAKLRQYPWQPCLDWTGNHGGHYGAYQPGFLRAAVLPLLLPEAR